MPEDIAGLIRRGFTRSKVSIVEFAESDRYIGKPLYPLQRVLLKLIFLEEMTGEEEDLLSFMIDGGRGREFELSPDIRKRRDYCRDRGYEHFSEVDIVAGRRAGKNHLCGIIGARKAWDVVQISDPGEFFGIDVDKEIYIACIANSLKVAKERQFADLYSSITRCDPLMERVPPTKALEESISIKTDADDRNIMRLQAMGKKVNKSYAKIQVQPMAANAATVRGLTIIWVCFDEMAHMQVGDNNKATAGACYDALEPSLVQFGHHALVLCLSSPWTKVGKFYDLVQLAMKPLSQEGAMPMRFAIRHPSWSMYDYFWKDKRWSNAIMVSPDWPDQLDPNEPNSRLDDLSVEKRVRERLRELANPETYKVEHRSLWAEVSDAYLDPHRVEAAFTGELPDGRPCKMTSGGQGYLFSYRAHCDPSSTTAGFGFAIAHVEEFEDPTGMFPGGLARHVVFDRVWRWNPSDFPGHTINYIKVREELQYWLQVYMPEELSFDQFNSVGLTQELREFLRGTRINTRIGEVTATATLNWNRWETFKTALYLGLVHVPNDCIDEKTGFNHSEWTKLELKFLQAHPAGQVFKVDKQDQGPVTTKDCSDCLAEVTNKFLGSYLGNLDGNSLAVPLSAGAMGGFQIGGRNQGGPFAQDTSSRQALEAFKSNRSFNSPSRTRGVMRDYLKGRRRHR